MLKLQRATSSAEFGFCEESEYILPTLSAVIKFLNEKNIQTICSQKGAVVAEGFIITDWIDLSAPTRIQSAFLASLVTADLAHTHFFAFYSALVDRLIALDCARLTGNYRLESTIKRIQARQKQLAACHELELHITELRVALMKESQFNRQVELNTKIKQLEQKLNRETSFL